MTFNLAELVTAVAVAFVAGWCVALSFAAWMTDREDRREQQDQDGQDD